jgi:hypothetical protein
MLNGGQYIKPFGKVRTGGLEESSRVFHQAAGNNGVDIVEELAPS